jgi:hypothetical protein
MLEDDITSLAAAGASADRGAAPEAFARLRCELVGHGTDWGLSLAPPVIVKYRDSRTNTRTELEAWIR